MAASIILKTYLQQQAHIQQQAHVEQQAHLEPHTDIEPPEGRAAESPAVRDDEGGAR
jgi:hypothetical protein